jgi:hypothetical protein
VVSGISGRLTLDPRSDAGRGDSCRPGTPGSTDGRVGR